MSIRYSRYLSSAILITDLVLLNLALFISEYFNKSHFVTGHVVQFGLFSNLFWLGITAFSKTHVIPRPSELKTHLNRLAVALIYHSFATLLCVWFYRLSLISLPAFLLFYLLFLVFLIVERRVLFAVLDSIRTHGYNHRQIIIIGDQSLFDRIKRLFDSHPEYGYDIIDFISIDELMNISENAMHQKLLSGNPDEIFICYIEFNERLLNLLIRFGNHHSVKIKVISDLILEDQFVHLVNYNNLPVLHVTSQPKVSLKVQILKRAFDIVFSSMVMILGLPVFLILFIITKFSSKGPAFYKQERIGKDGKPFYIYKFRSMCMDSERFGPQLSSADDPRITKWGRVIRRTRMDELPQFWNVLKGDMAIVGHRPERQHFIEKIVERNPNYKNIFKMKPGLTSIGQVHYGYAENVDQMCDRLHFDLLYHQNITLNHDFNIIMKTIKVMVQSKGK